jgi:tetratricopeptide (TPR) repeat protein
MVRELETLQAMEIRALVREHRDIPGYVRVIVPATGSMFFEIAPYSAAGYFGVGPLEEPTAVIHPAALSKDPEIIAHELGHHVVWYFFPRHPGWFSEGFANFVQTVANPKFRGSVGLVPTYLSWRLHATPRIPASALLSDTGYNYRADPSVWTWLLYHWLWNERPRQFGDYQYRLARAEDPARAWLGAFPEFNPLNDEAMHNLGDALERHRWHGEFTFYKVDANPDTRFTQETISSARVHLLLLGIRYRWNEFYHRPPVDGDDLLPTARFELAEALREDPLEPVAIWLSDRLSGEAKVNALRNAAASKADDWRGWYILSKALEVPAHAGEREAALRRAVSLNPDSAAAQNLLASQLLDSGRPEEAASFARRAVELAPSGYENLVTLGAVAAAVGACPEALALQRRAVDVIFDEKKANDARRRLRDLEQHCKQ